MAESFPDQVKTLITSSRSAENPKQDKYKDEHTQAYHNQTAENERYRENQDPKKKDTLHEGEQQYKG